MPKARIMLATMQLKPLLIMLLVYLLFVTLDAQGQQRVFPDYKVEKITEGLNFPWSLAFLPKGGLLITERTGHLYVINSKGEKQSITGLPDDIYVKSQGGLMEVLLHPDFNQNSWVYLTYSAGTDANNQLKVVRAKLEGNQLIERQTILTVFPSKDTPVHYAGRMTFLADGTLLVTSGDGFDYREDAQKMTSLLGKVIRINDDGSLPTDNPFYLKPESEGASPPLSAYIYSLGHRNAQGILYDAKRQVIFSNEHGPDGGDELNIIQKGFNYGWPVVTYGKDYMGSRISPFTEYPNMQLPLIDWTPSIAPSGMALHQGKMFSSLNGDLLVSVLKFKEVRWVQMQGMQVTGQVSLFKELKQRIRDVRVHTDGSIYLLTDSNNGKILRISPAIQ